MNTMKYAATSVLTLLLTMISWAAQEPNGGHTPDARMLRFPDVSADKIVFSYAGDLWTVAKEGGVARRLSSPKGAELFPKFSPDGTMIAFSGNYDGNVDVYVVSAEGGKPKRLTYHPDDDLVVEWYPDGKNILYRSGMTSPSIRFNRFFKQPIEGGIPQPLPLPYGELASFSPDGSRIAFQFISREFRTWKRYRGGMASDLWLYDFVNNTSEKITDFPGTDAVPMWHGNTIYFLSDRDTNQKLNIWAYDLRTRQTREITKFADYDVKWPSIGDGAIVFENGGTLHLLDLVTEISKPLEIRVPDDLPEVRTELKDVSDYIQNYSLSPTGKRALFEARGEVFTIPEKHGSVRDLTNTSGAAERDPAWSPDGRWVAWLSDLTGEYELYLMSGEGKGEPNQITKNGSVFRYNPVWSPDSKKIAFSDKTGSLYIVDVKTTQVRFVDKDPWDTMDSYAWSPDSRWLSYSKRMSNRHGAIMIYDVNDGAVHQVTSDYYEDTDPIFDTEGTCLFFRSDRAFRPVYGDMDDTWVYPNATKIYAVTLKKDSPSIVAPRSDEEEAKKKETEKKTEVDPNNAEDQAAGKDANEPAAGKTESVPPVKIDFEEFEQRVVELPIDPGNIGAIQSAKDKLVFLRRPPAGTAKRDEPSATLYTYDLKEREEKTVIDGIDDYRLSADGKKVLYKSKSVYGIIDLAENKKVGDGKIASGDLKAWINPQEEWRQIFTDAWRIERDFFYDPNVHGVDWQAMKERYGALLPYVVDRQDLNYIIGEMIAELNASHTYVGGGDIEKPKTLSVGLLGCDFELDANRNAYRIAKIYRGAAWDTEARSPLTEPGLDVREGDYLLSVNGRAVDTSEAPWAAFQGLADELVTLTISHTGDSNDTNDVQVKPISSEFRLRNLAWIEANRQKVERATQGRVGYIYVPDTGTNGQSELVRQFTPQWNKEALVIDERFNSGGQCPDRFIELLNRPIYNYWARRDHQDWQTPSLANGGPKVMIINGWSGSGGDAFPYYFREAHLGPLVGTRTWGGLIGITRNPELIDGGFVSAPAFAFYRDGKWGIEGYGVDPDYEVENAPHEMVAGRDPQLDTAIVVVLKLLEKQPPAQPERPPYPNRSSGAR
jgi:tricorn protease